MALAGLHVGYAVASVIDKPAEQYTVIITHSTEGDLTLPASMITAVLRPAGSVSSLTISTPRYDLVTDIASRESGGRLTVQRQLVYPDTTVTEEWLDFPFSEFFYDYGPTSRTLRLKGTTTIYSDNPIAAEVSPVEIRLRTDGDEDWQCVYPLPIPPDSTVNQAGGASYRVLQNQITLSATETRQKILVDI